MSRHGHLEVEAIETQERFPNETKRAVAAIDSDLRWKIVELLLSYKELSYTELLKKVGIPKGRLNYHLNQLKKGAILDNYAREDFETLYDSYYSISRFGHQFFQLLKRSMEPPTPHKVPIPSNASQVDWIAFFDTHPRPEDEMVVSGYTISASVPLRSGLISAPKQKIRVPVASPTSANEGIASIPMLSAR